MLTWSFTKIQAREWQIAKQTLQIVLTLAGIEVKTEYSAVSDEPYTYQFFEHSYVNAHFNLYLYNM